MNQPFDDITRRVFLQTTAAGAAAMGIGGGVLAAEDKARKVTSETLAAQLYGSLTETQRETLCFDFDYHLRHTVDNNWHITKSHIDELLTPEQQALTKELFLSMHSEEYAPQVLKQVEHDAGKRGFGDVSIAFFGKPATTTDAGDGFEFVLTGRHVTRRCDGNSVKGAAFGGPLFYGHAAKSFNEGPDHAGNIYWYQAKRANAVFEMLDGKQRETALVLDKAPPERGTRTVKLGGDRAGIAMTDLSDDQQDLVRKVMGDVLAPYRKVDVDETLKLVEANGFDKLNLAFYKDGDIGNDGVWDNWRIEGPAALMYFRGAPHVHAWLHVRENVETA